MKYLIDTCVISETQKPVTDSQIAATALCHNLTLVTRNTRDFAQTGVKLLNPFE